MEANKIELVEKILTYGVTPTIIVFIAVQIFIHLRKKRIEEFEDDKNKLIQCLKSKKANFAYNSFPSLNKHTINKINSSDKHLLKSIRSIFDDKITISTIKNNCDLLISRINDL